MGAGRVLANLVGVPLLATSLYFTHSYMDSMNNVTNQDVNRSLVLKGRIKSFDGAGRESDQYNENVNEYNLLLKNSGEDIERFEDHKIGFMVSSTLTLVALLGLVEINFGRKRKNSKA
jgi:hypothetical protein